MDEKRIQSSAKPIQRVRPDRETILAERLSQLERRHFFRFGHHRGTKAYNKWLAK